MMHEAGADGYRMVVEERRGVPVAKFSGEDFSNPSLLEDAFQALVSHLKHREVVVDLSDVRNTVSLGVAVLIAAQGLALIHETRLAFAALSPGVKKLLTMTGADEVLKIFDTVEDAIDWVKRDSGRG